MNVLERKMIDVLKTLKNEFGVYEIKCEFEAEGSRMEELMRLKDLTSAVGLPIILKTGGVEAVTDVYNAMALGTKGIIAPMAQTPFALSKFLNVIDNFIPEDNREDIEFAFNLETITAFQHLDEMLKLPKINLLQGMTIGRVDLIGSMALERSEIDSDHVLDICHTAFAKAREAGLSTGLGGGISTNTLNFISSLNEKNLIDKFETRKVVFHADAVKYGEKAILKAIEFELGWLESKERYYSRVKSEDTSRIEMLRKRLAAAN